MREPVLGGAATLAIGAWRQQLARATVPAVALCRGLAFRRRRVLGRLGQGGPSTELYEPLCFLLALSLLLLHVLIEVVQNVMQHQVVAVLVLRL